MLVRMSEVGVLAVPDQIGSWVFVLAILVGLWMILPWA
jgi:hypothetical protein